MDMVCWIHHWGQSGNNEKLVLTKGLESCGLKLEPLDQKSPCGAGVCVFSEVSPELCEFLQQVSRGGRERMIAVANPAELLNGTVGWEILQSGASDVLVWSDPQRVARQVHARIMRWHLVDQLMENPTVTGTAIGKSSAWRGILRNIVEIAHFSNAPALILGESGTGKEVIANLIHQLDPRPNKRDLVILDCSTLVPQLSGSEFFGHERGAFTGAMSEREGAFAMANGGTLFLDEIGELPLPMQAQLLRVIQEHSYKRVGGNIWRKTDFRLVCATNRDLLEMVQRGEFRADLYFRIASFVCKLPPLRERIEDVIPLAEHFLRQIHPNGEPPEFDNAVLNYLLRREYPGNIRDLMQVVCRLMYRYTGDGMITLGNVPPEERVAQHHGQAAWSDLSFDRVIQRAVQFGLGLKEIGRAAEDAAIRFATDEEGGNIQRAARRLGVTDRALQLRRASKRQNDEDESRTIG